MTIYEIQAVQILNQLRRGTMLSLFFIESLRKSLTNGRLSLNEIGTDEEELTQLRIRNSKFGAANWLDLLRRGTEKYDEYVDNMRRELEAGDLTLRDLGTSEDEINSLKRVSRIAIAKKWLTHLRNGDNGFDIFLCYLNSEMNIHRLTPEDIGSSTTEIQSFMKKV